MTSKVGSLIISLALESGAFKSGLSASEKELKAATRRMENLGKSLQGLGQKMSLAVTLPMAALAKVSVSAAMESADALGQVNQALSTMGGAAGRTAEQLQALANGQMHKSLYDDDEILRKVTANLLTFGKIGGAAFDGAQQAALDLSARLGTDLQSSALMVGKALNDPIKGLTALTRAGVSFTEQQKAQIKAMVEAGDVAGAQKLILGELEKQFGGSAAAAMKNNPFAQLQHSLDDFQEAVGGVLLKILPPLTNALNGAVDAFNNLSPGTQEVAVKLGLIAAAAGPVMTVFGMLATAAAPFTGAMSLIAAEGGVLPALQAGFTGLATVLGPVLVPLAAIAAAGAVIYANWDKIAPVLQETGKAIMDAIGPVVTDLLATAKQAFDDFMGSDFVAMVTDFAGVIGNVGLVLLKAFGGALPGVVKAIGELVVGAFKVIVDAVKIVGAVLTGDWAGAWAAAKDLVFHAVQAIGGAIADLAEAAMGFISGMVRGIQDWIGAKLNAIWQGVIDKIKWVKGAFFGLYDAVVGHSYIPDMVDGIAAHMSRLGAVMVDPALSATERTKQAFEQLGSDVQGIMATLFPDAKNLSEFRDQLAALDQGIKAGGAGGYSAEQLQAGRQRLLGGADRSTLSGTALPLADQLALMQEAAAPMGEINDALQKLTEAANDNAADIGVANVRIAKSFKDMANDTLGVLNNLAQSIKGGGFLDILSSVINLGLQLGSVGLFGKSIQSNINKVPGYAGGTNYHPGGLAIVGERGPELVNLPRGASVTPNHAMASGGGRTRVEVVPSPFFDVRVRENINAAAPGIAQAGAEAGMRRMAFANSRRVA